MKKKITCANKKSNTPIKNLSLQNLTPRRKRHVSKITVNTSSLHHNTRQPTPNLRPISSQSNAPHSSTSPPFQFPPLSSLLIKHKKTHYYSTKTNSSSQRVYVTYRSMTSLAFHSTGTSHSYSPYRTGPNKVKFNKNQIQMQCVKAKKLTGKSRICSSLVPVEETDSTDISYDSFDEWMRKSVTEIVKNIKQAPLLVQVYADGEVEMEKAVEAKNWPNVVWENPEGVILVEELRESENVGESEKAFGVLIQGKCKGRDSRCKSACYLLKTSSVNGGMGAFCTHFCLMKVRSFGQSASSQLNECWLLQ